MLQKIINFLMGRKSVDGVVSKFNEQVQELRQVEAMRADEADKHHAKILKTTSLRDAALTEAARARRVAANINAMVDGFTAA